MKVWHFICSDMMTGEGGLVVEPGQTLAHDGEVMPCKSGLHGSVKALDALKYAPGPVVCRVELGGEIVGHGDPIDKYAASERTCLWMTDATDVLRRFARLCALGVINQWDAPEVVVRYLRTGDESVRVAARYAALSATKVDFAAYAAWYATNTALYTVDSVWSVVIYAARSMAYTDDHYDKQERILVRMLNEAHRRSDE